MGWRDAVEQAREQKRHDDLFAAQKQLGDIVALVEGEVTSLKRNGFTDGQARAIIAGLLGWQPPKDAPDEQGGS